MLLAALVVEPSCLAGHRIARIRAATVIVMNFNTTVFSHPSSSAGSYRFANTSRFHLGKMTHAWVGHVKWCPCWVYLFAGAAPIPHEATAARCTISAARQRDQSEELRPTVMHRLSKKAQCGRRGFLKCSPTAEWRPARASFHICCCAVLSPIDSFRPAVAPSLGVLALPARLWWAPSLLCTQCRVLCRGRH